MKDKVIIAMTCAEFGWEVLRVAPHVLWLKVKKYHNNVKLIIYTRQDRFDLYGIHADEFVPLNIEGDYTKYQADCFKLVGFPDIKYYQMMEELCQQYAKKYEIVERIQPNIQGKKYTQKGQFSRHEMLYRFIPREENKKVIDSYIPNDKPLISLAPRYRKQGTVRNWPHWETFYDLIETDEFFKSFNFVICGKHPEYIPDKKDRFIDVNKIPQKENTSLTGYTIEVIRRSVLTVGSQSGVPNLSNLVQTPTLQWGNEPRAHKKLYNFKNTPTTFIRDSKFKIKPEVVLDNMKQILTKRRKQNV